MPSWNPSYFGWSGNVFALIGVLAIGAVICVVTARMPRFTALLVGLVITFLWWNFVVGSDMALWIVLLTIVANRLVPDRWKYADAEIKSRAEAPVYPGETDFQATCWKEKSGGSARIIPPRDPPNRRAAPQQQTNIARRVRDYYLIPAGLGDKRSDWFVPIADAERCTSSGGYQIHYKDPARKRSEDPDFVHDDAIDVIKFDQDFATLRCPACRQRMRGRVSRYVKVVCPKCYYVWVQRLS